MSPSVLASEWETNRRASSSQWAYKGHLRGCFHKLTATSKCDKTATVIEATLCSLLISHTLGRMSKCKWVSLHCSTTLHGCACSGAGPPPKEEAIPSWRQNTWQSSAWPSMQCLVVLLLFFFLAAVRIFTASKSEIKWEGKSDWMCNVFRVGLRKKLDKSK